MNKTTLSLVLLAILLVPAQALVFKDRKSVV